MAREEYLKEISSFSAEQLVYVDESGMANNITVSYGWSLLGERSYAETEGFASDRRNIVAAYNYGTKEILAPFEYSGHTDKQLFVSCFTLNSIVLYNFTLTLLITIVLISCLII